MKKHAFFSILALVFAGWAAQAGALQVLIDAYWSDINTSSPKEGGGSNLTTGSIVQVVLYNSGSPTDVPSTTDPAGNFQPYGDSWIPNSTRANNQIVYTGQITVTGTTAEFYQWVDIPNELLAVYDRYYVRVFSATEFAEGEALPSYWGISDIYTIPEGSGGTDWSWFDDVVVTNLANFEVIPEPGVLSLFAMGAWGLGCAAARRRKHRESKDSPKIREREP